MDRGILFKNQGNLLDNCTCARLKRTELDDFIKAYCSRT